MFNNELEGKFARVARVLGAQKHTRPEYSKGVFTYISLALALLVEKHTSPSMIGNL